MLPQSISLGPFTIHFYGLIIAVAIYAGWFLAKKRATVYKIPQTLFEDPILLVPLLLAIIGARLYHVADYWQYYRQNPLEIIKISSGGLGIFGALAGVVIGFWIIAKVKKLDLMSLLDLASPSLLLGQSIGRIGNFINQEGFGPPTNLPWGIYISPENRPAQYFSSPYFHPTFFYEAILDAIFFVILIYLSRPSSLPPLLSFPQKRESRTRLSSGFRIKSGMTKEKTGQTFALYLILYSLGRFIVEFWRIDTAIVDGIKVAQVLSIAAFLTGILLMVKLNFEKRNSSNKSKYPLRL